MRTMMRACLRALAISSALIAAFVLPPATAQSIAPGPSVVPVQSGPAAESNVPAKGDGTAVKTDSPAKGGDAASVPEHDVKTVLSELILAWHNYDACDRAKACSASFETFGVAITFNDGTIVPFAHMQRNRTSAHDCIVNAREALAHGDRGMAVQWVMASYLHDAAFRNWLADHPDAVVAALQRCCY
jgi:hypothetical protein